MQPVNSYPVFTANQLLSNRDLNDVVDYLEQQTRITRLCLTGAGIVCGLHVHLDGDTVHISAGTGVTSEGYLIRLNACELTHRQTVKITRGMVLGANATDAGETLNVDELFAVEQEESHPLTGDEAKDRVALLLLEPTFDAGDICIDDCDAKGGRMQFRTRKFLLTPVQANALILDAYNPETNDLRRFQGMTDLEQLLNSRYGLPDVFLERFGYTPPTGATPAAVNFTEITTYKIFLDRYQSVLTTGGTRLQEALAQAHKIFSPIFSGPRPAPLAALTLTRFDFSAATTLEQTLGIQYAHDHLADLARAYAEFRTVAFDVVDTCAIDSGWFPKHLFLGLVTEQGTDLSGRATVDRTQHAQPPVYNGNRQRTHAARGLFRRLMELTTAYHIPAPTTADDIKITPSRWGTAELSARAIPFYYDLAGGAANPLVQTWNADRHRRDRDRQVHSYARIPGTGAQNDLPFEAPLGFHFERDEFYRIEGHVGLPQHEAFERIVEQREQYNLAFDLVVLRFGDVSKDLEEHVCDFEVLNSQYVKLRTDLLCRSSLDRFPLELLPIELLNFKMEGFEARFRSMSDDKECFQGISIEAFREIEKLSTRRKSAIEALQSFHVFAKKHPGMEHRAGVPQGGTFIIVYEDVIDQDTGSIAGKTVVADFCLPYLCCSPCPPTAYVVARPRPQFSMTPTTFCADDDTKYRFTMDPEGGLVTGQGTDSDAEGDFFSPKLSGVAHGPITHTYTVEGADATSVVQILRVPQATFQLDDHLCHDAHYELVLAAGSEPGGRFTTDIDPDNPTLGIIFDNRTDTSYFHAAAKGVPQEQTIRVTYTVKGSNDCAGTHTNATVVHTAPDATFSLPESFCSDGNPFTLTAKTPGSFSVFRINGETVTVFDPDRYKSTELKHEVTVRHTVTDRRGCTNSLNLVTTIFLTIKAGEYRGQPIVQNGNQGEIQINNISPNFAGSGLTFIFAWMDGAENRHSQVRSNADSFLFKFPINHLKGLEVFKLALIVANGDCHSTPLVRTFALPKPNTPGTTIPPTTPGETSQPGGFTLSAVTDRAGGLDRLKVHHDDIEDSQSFKLVYDFVAKGTDVAADDAVVRFSKSISTIVPIYKRTEESRKGAYSDLAAISTSALLDAVSDKPLNARMRKRTIAALAKMAEGEIDTLGIRDQWLTTDKAKSLTDAQRQAVTALFN